MAKEITQYVIDACALIAYVRNEQGGDKLRELFSGAHAPLYLRGNPVNIYRMRI